MSAQEAPVGYEADLPDLPVWGGKVVVLDKCDDVNATGQWLCLTHKEPFQHNLAMHLHSATGTHVVAWICHAHGIETP